RLRMGRKPARRWRPLRLLGFLVPLPHGRGRGRLCRFPLTSPPATAARRAAAGAARAPPPPGAAETARSKASRHAPIGKLFAGDNLFAGLQLALEHGRHLGEAVICNPGADHHRPQLLIRLEHVDRLDIQSSRTPASSAPTATGESASATSPAATTAKAATAFPTALPPHATAKAAAAFSTTALPAAAAVFALPARSG